MSIIKKFLSRSGSGKRTGESDAIGPDTSPLDCAQFDPLADAFIQNPYPVLRALRQQAPLLRLRNGSWVMTRHSDIVAALSNPGLGNSPSPFAVVNGRNSGKYTCAAVANNTLPFLDAPGHTDLRKGIATVFLKQLASDQVDFTQMVSAHLERLAAKPFDLVQDFATPLCVEMMAGLFGMPPLQPAEVRQLKDWSSWFFYLFSIIPDESTLERLNVELGAFRQFMAEHLVSQRDISRENLAAGMMGLVDSSCGEQQIIDNSLLLMADGVNADFGVANAVLTLAQHPQHFQSLQNESGLWGSAAAELLRFESPSSFIARRALEDLEIGGHSIRKNSGVLLMLASANRDEQVFERPDQLDFSRKHNPYLTFGKGAHACLGRVLVLNLVKALIECLAERVTQIELVEGAPRWESRAGHRWPVSTKIRFSPRIGI